MKRRDEYFARVRPILGDGLTYKTIAVEGLSAWGRVLELLAACMLGRIVVRDLDERIAWPLLAACRGPEAPGSGMNALTYLKRHLRWKNGFAAVRWLTTGTADLTLRAELVEPGTCPSLTWDRDQKTLTLRMIRGDLWSYLNISNAAAREARDVLLGRMPWPMGTRYFGSHDWPFAMSSTPMSGPEKRPSQLSGVHLMVVGCGSVGSEIIRRFAGGDVRWTLVDPGKVSIFNPHRQWFGTSDVGKIKVHVLAQRLAPRQVRPLERRLNETNLGELGELLVADRPDAVILTTGTSDDAALAEMFWRHRIPYVTAYAYPQARYFEITVASPSELTPCLHCFRGHLYKGVEAAPPMTDEIASFLYREPDSKERERAYVNLVAEPATPMETQRVADVAAQALVELLSPNESRAAWFARLIRDGTTCLLGANVAETRDGEPVYGMTYPGQVVRLGLGDVVGAETERVCDVCGRELEVTHRVELPQACDADVDTALLA